MSCARSMKGNMMTIVLSWRDRLLTDWQKVLRKFFMKAFERKTDESLSTEELLKQRYAGIRAAPGYPSQPDHQEKETLWKLGKVDELSDMRLTSSYAVWPAASVSALVFGRRKSQYFGVGKLGLHQMQDYAKRKCAPRER